MEKSYMLSILRDLISSCLGSIIDRNQMYLKLIQKISPCDVVEYDDELLIESYFAKYHMYEKYCEVSDEELLYLRDCLEGKYEFSRIERDKIITKD